MSKKSGKKIPQNTTGEVAGYVRVSDVKSKFPDGCISFDDRAAFVDRLRRLRMAELIADAAAQGEEITAWYDDMGISGRGEMLIRRIDFDRARVDAKAGKIRTLFARDLSRLFRDLVQQELWFADMEAWGCRVSIQDLPFIADAATRILLRQNLGSLNQYMATKTGEMLRLTHGERVKAGLWAGASQSLWGLRYNKETHHYDFDPETADPIRFVFETLVACGGVAGQAARRLNEAWDAGHERATLTPTGKHWTAQFVLRYARNRKYAREIHYFQGQDDEIILHRPDLLPEVVDPALVAEVRRLLVQRAPANLSNAAKAKASRLDYTYSQVLRCGECGGKLRTNRPKDYHGRMKTPPGQPPAWIAWTCTCATDCAVPKEIRCQGFGSIQQRRLDALVGEGLRYALSLYGERHFPSVQTSGARLHVQALRKRSVLTPEGDKANLEMSLSHLDARRRRLHQMFASEGESLMSLPELQGYLAEVSAERVRIESRLSSLGESQDAAPAALPALSREQWVRLLAQISQIWQETETQALNLPKHDLLLSLGVTCKVSGLPRVKKRRHRGSKREGKRLPLLRGRACLEMEIAALGLTGESSVTLTESEEAYQDYLHWTYWGNRGVAPPKQPSENHQ